MEGEEAAPAPPVNLPPRRGRWRRGLLVAGGVVLVLFGLFCLVQGWAYRRGVLVREIVSWNYLDAAVRVYHNNHGTYPASLQDPRFQPVFAEYMHGPTTNALIRAGRLTYHAPAAHSPPEFILVRLTTPYGVYATRLDGERVHLPR